MRACHMQCVCHVHTEPFNKASCICVAHRTRSAEVASRITCCTGVGAIAAATHHQANAMDPPAEAPPPGDAAAMVLHEPQHNEQGAAPSVDVQRNGSVAAGMTSPSQHEDPQHALQMQQPQGQPAVGDAAQAEADSAAPVASATPQEPTPALPLPFAVEQAGATIAAATVAEARAPEELAVDKTLDNVLHDIVIS